MCEWIKLRQRTSFESSGLSTAVAISSGTRIAENGSGKVEKQFNTVNTTAKPWAVRGTEAGRAIHAMHWCEAVSQCQSFHDA
jgi:hypothetical protein